jgi:hypothetical protein
MTILFFHIISARPSKQLRMVGSTLGVYSFVLIFVSARTNKRHHHHRHYRCDDADIVEHQVCLCAGVANTAVLVSMIAT